MVAAADTAQFAALARAGAIMLTTYKRDGTPVGTPVWPIGRDGVIYTTSVVGAGKVKRIRRDGRVTVATCTQTGKVTGPTMEARAQLAPEKTAEMVAAKTRRYGLFSRFFLLMNRLQGEREQIAIAIMPALPAPPIA